MDSFKIYIYIYLLFISSIHGTAHIISLPFSCGPAVLLIKCAVQQYAVVVRVPPGTL